MDNDIEDPVEWFNTRPPNVQSFIRRFPPGIYEFPGHGAMYLVKYDVYEDGGVGASFGTDPDRPQESVPVCGDCTFEQIKPIEVNDSWIPQEPNHESQNTKEE